MEDLIFKKNNLWLHMQRVSRLTISLMDLMDLSRR